MSLVLNENNFKKHEKPLTALLMEQVEGYFKSRTFKNLSGRYWRLKDSVDMNFNGSGNGNSSNGRGRSRSRNSNTTKSKMSFPLLKQRTILRRAIISQNYRAEPLFTSEPTGSTSPEIANNLQDVLNSNFKSTKFMSKVFQNLKDDLSIYGTAVNYTAWSESNKQAKKTISTPLGPQRQLVKSVRKNAVNRAVHILDYFQNAKIADPDDSEFQGHIEMINLSKLVAAVEMNPEAYITENVKAIIKRAKKESIKDKNYHEKSDDSAILSGGFEIERRIIYSTCAIEGNEDNENYYYIEMIAGKIVRFQENPHDDDTRMYAVINYYKRRDAWWGNSDAELVLPHERYTNLMMGMKADQALRSLQSYLFYERGTIDVADWNNRHKNGGFVPVKPGANQNISNLLYQHQPQDQSLNTVDSMMRDVKESEQKLTPRPDLSRAAKSGGLQNTTATAANILDEQGDVVESEILENISYGLKRVASNNAIMLQQRLPDRFAIRPKITEGQRELTKEEILGDASYHIETSLNKNKASELLRLQNIITMFMNFKGSGDPALSQLDMTEIFKKLLKQADVGDVDGFFPTQPQQQLPGAVPSAPQAPQEADLEQAGAVQQLTRPQTQEGALNDA